MEFRAVFQCFVLMNWEYKVILSFQDYLMDETLIYYGDVLQRKKMELENLEAWICTCSLVSTQIKLQKLCILTLCFIYQTEFWSKLIYFPHQEEKLQWNWQKSLVTVISIAHLYQLLKLLLISLIIYPIRIRSLLCSHIHYLKIQQQPTESLVWSYEAKVNQMTALMPKGISVSPGPRQLQLFVPQSLFIKFIFLLLKCSCNTWSRCQC